MIASPLATIAASTTTLAGLQMSLCRERDRLLQERAADAETTVLLVRIDQHLEPIIRELTSRRRREAGDTR